MLPDVFVIDRCVFSRTEDRNRQVFQIVICFVKRTREKPQQLACEHGVSII